MWVKYKNRYVKELEQKQKDYQNLLSQKKSSEIILGQITEKLVPFLDNFPHNPQNATFIGMPIDYIVFEDDMIYFVEVKSGNSKLSKKQRNIKNLIKEKKVEWSEIKIR
jgi:predicted Holliday junction resolvase-like endonuclease